MKTMLLILSLVVLIQGCAGYACAPARWSGYSCPTPQKVAQEKSR